MKRSWLIVAGDYHRTGGQDRANLELATYLASRPENVVHLVGHDFDSELLRSAAVTTHRVARPLGSHFLGERALAREAADVVRRIAPRPIVISNGGNFLAGDVNWVHCVHAFWPAAPFGGSLKARLLGAVAKTAARRREIVALKRARAIIANSDKTRAHIIALGIDPARVARVYFGSTPFAPSEPPKAPRLLFVGALGWDKNKGLDRLLAAMHLLVRDGGADHSLRVIGAGETAPWRRMAERLGLGTRVHFAGKVPSVGPAFQESRLLVSPSRYEAYGLAIQEAFTHGVPAMVTRTAGVAERYPNRLADLLVDNTDSPGVWAAAIARVLANLEQLKGAVHEFGRELSRRSWGAMAEDIELEIHRRVETADAPPVL